MIKSRQSDNSSVIDQDSDESNEGADQNSEDLSDEAKRLMESFKNFGMK